MFDYSLVHWTTFLLAAALLSLSPGPDLTFILGQTARGGRRAGFAAMFGIWTGAMVHVVMAAIGLSAILATSAAAYTIVKWAGAFYLIYLGIQALRSKGDSIVADVQLGKSSTRKIYSQGILICALNPKVAIFFLAFLPQFVVEGAGPAWAQLALHGALIIVVAAFIEPPIVIIGDRLVRLLKGSKRFALWLDRVLGTLLVSFGVKLALSDR